MASPVHASVVLVTTPPPPDEARLRAISAEAVVLMGEDAARHAHAVVRARPDLPLVAVAGEDDASGTALLAVADEVVPAHATVGDVAEAVGLAIDRRAHHLPVPPPTPATPPLPRQLQTIGRLAGGVGHEFNNLLLVIDANTDLLRQHLPQEPRLQEACDEIVKACDRAATLTRQLLAFGRQQALLPAPVHLNDIVAELAPLLRQAMGPHVQLVLRLAPDLPQVRVDPAQMREVLSNLAGMAIQAMTGAGRLTIATDACRMTPADRAGRPWLRPGDYVRLRVSDTGRSIAADTLPHLFDPFVLPADAPRGGGLTLSSAYGVVKQSGGYIWADSRIGEGSSVTILLPPLDVPEAAVTYRAREDQTATPRVLLVEDLDGVRDVLASLLELRGFEVVAAGSAEEALELARAQRFDILLTDVSLPGATGPELAERLQQESPEMPVLFMSGHPAAAFDSITLTDPRTFLQKPFSADTLAGRLRDLLKRRVDD